MISDVFLCGVCTAGCYRIYDGLAGIWECDHCGGRATSEYLTRRDAPVKRIKTNTFADEYELAKFGPIKFHADTEHFAAGIESAMKDLTEAFKKMGEVIPALPKEREEIPFQIRCPDCGARNYTVNFSYSTDKLEYCCDTCHNHWVPEPKPEKPVAKQKMVSVYFHLPEVFMSGDANWLELEWLGGWNAAITNRDCGKHELFVRTDAHGMLGYSGYFNLTDRLMVLKSQVRISEKTLRLFVDWLSKNIDMPPGSFIGYYHIEGEKHPTFLYVPEDE